MNKPRTSASQYFRRRIRQHGILSSRRNSAKGDLYSTKPPFSLLKLCFVEFVLLCQCHDGLRGRKISLLTPVFTEILFTYTLIFFKTIQCSPLLFKIRITKRNKAKISCKALKVAWQPSIFHFYLWNIFLHHYLWWTRLNCMWFICCYCYSKITWLSRHRLACFHNVNFENFTPVGLYTSTKNIYNTWLLSKAFPLVVKFYKTFPS